MRYPTSSFTLTSDPRAAACPATLGERRFMPTYTSKSGRPSANAYSPFNVHIGRRRRRAGAEGRRRDPAEGAFRQNRRHPLLLGGGDHRRGWPRPAPPSWPRRAVRPTARSVTRPLPRAAAATRSRSPARPTSPALTRARRSRWWSSPRPSPAPTTSAPSWSGSRSRSTRKRPRPPHPFRLPGRR